LSNFVAICLISRATGQAEILTSPLTHNLPNNTITPGAASRHL
jgi:hypothetical protein